MRVVIALLVMCLPALGAAQTLTGVALSVSPSTFQVGQTASVTCTNTYSDNSHTTTCATINNNVVVNGAPTASVSGTTLTGLSPGATYALGCFNSCASTSTGGTFTVTPPNAEYLGTVSAAQVAAGLGFNLGDTAWEYQVAAAAGAKFGRIQCSWVSTEIQNAPPLDTSGGYSLQSSCVTDLVSAKTYGVKPTIVAAYGAPYHQILTVTVPAGAAQGATSFSITYSSGVGGDTLSSMRAIWNTFSSNGSVSTNGDYGGSLITGVTVQGATTTATITLASGLTNALPANSTQYQINEYLYQPAQAATYTNASVAAYAHYAQYLAQQIGSAGLTGQVELWNEPPWGGSCWDNYVDCFDTYSGGALPGLLGNSSNMGLAAAVQNLVVPNNVSYIWAGTNKSGDNTLLGGNMLSATGLALSQPSISISSESLHPYGNNPEDSMWTAPCLKAAASSGYFNGLQYQCNLFGVPGGNASEGSAYTAAAKYTNTGYGLPASITETGVPNTQVNQTQAARFIMRQFLGYQAAGVTPIEFYRLYDQSGNFTFGTYSGGVFTPYQQYTSLSSFMSDVNSFKAPPVSGMPSNLIASYGGLTWPLDSMQIVGSLRSTDSVNSVMVVAWQRTYLNGASSAAQWASVSSPTGGNITVNIPSGTHVVKVVDTVTRSAVSYTTASNQITVPVADNPVEMLFEPQSLVAQHNLGPFNGKFN